MKHGHYATYTKGGCRCDQCREANRAYNLRLRRTRYEHQWDPSKPATPTDLVDADPVRDHIRKLSAAGIGWKRVAELSGAPGSVVREILYGRKNPYRPPRLRVRRATADKILAVQPNFQALREGALIPNVGTKRRLEALMTLGYSLAALGRYLDVNRSNMRQLLVRPSVSKATAKRVAVLYEQLWDQPASPDDYKQSAITQTLNRARMKGYAPPAAWDNIDDSRERPKGVETEAASFHVEDVEHLITMGESPDSIATRFNVQPETLYMRLRRHGHYDLAARYGLHKRRAA